MKKSPMKEFTNHVDPVEFTLYIKLKPKESQKQSYYKT